ncbi:MAG: HAD family hydrolase [Acidothermaceae bacterium]
MLGLPDHVTTCLFDLDGVLTDTASVHDVAWTQMFDGYLRERSDRTGEAFKPFDPDADYAQFVDGRPRSDGVRAFLKSRGITVPEGKPTDPPSAETVYGLGNRKNDALLRAIDRDGVKVYEGSRRYLEAASDAGLRRVVVSSSANTAAVLKATSLDQLVEGWVDGVAIEREHLKGKPAPDTFVRGARCVHAKASESAVFEDAIAGVEAGRTGEFGYVVGVNRIGPEHGEQLRKHGADVVVADLSQLLDADGADSDRSRQPR